MTLSLLCEVGFYGNQVLPCETPLVVWCFAVLTRWEQCSAQQGADAQGIQTCLPSSGTLWAVSPKYALCSGLFLDCSVSCGTVSFSFKQFIILFVNKTLPSSFILKDLYVHDVHRKGIRSAFPWLCRLYKYERQTIILSQYDSK